MWTEQNTPSSSCCWSSKRVASQSLLVLWRILVNQIVHFRPRVGAYLVTCIIVSNMGDEVSQVQARTSFPRGPLAFPYFLQFRTYLTQHFNAALLINANNLYATFDRGACRAIPARSQASSSTDTEGLCKWWTMWHITRCQIWLVTLPQLQAFGSVSWIRQVLCLSVKFG